MKTILFYSYRGGTGRTTTLANVAVALCRWGARVCMVDLDLGAPGLGRWRSFRPEYGDFGDTFLKFFESLVKGSEPPKRLPLHRIQQVRFSDQDSKRIEPLELDEGGLWFLPPGPLDENYAKTLIEEIKWPLGEDPDKIIAAIKETVERVENELAPNYLLIDTPPGLGFNLTHILSALDNKINLIVFTTRISPQGYEGLDLATTIGEQLSKHQKILFPVVTFVPSGFQATLDFQKKIRSLEEHITHGRPIRHVIPLIPELGVEERILTVASPSEIPDSASYWEIARAITIEMKDGPGLYILGKRRERRELFQEAEAAYSQAYQRNPAYQVSMLGLARSYAHGQPDTERAEKWLKWFLREKALQRKTQRAYLELKRYLEKTVEKLGNNKDQKAFFYYKVAAQLASGKNHDRTQDYSSLLWKLCNVDRNQAQRIVKTCYKKLLNFFAYRFKDFYDSEIEFMEQIKSLPGDDDLSSSQELPTASYDSIAKDLADECDDLIRTLEIIADALVENPKPPQQSRRQDQTAIGLENFHERLSRYIESRRKELALKVDSIEPRFRVETLKFYNAFGAYNEQSLDEILRWNQQVRLFPYDEDLKPTNVLDIIEESLLKKEKEGESLPKYIPYRDGVGYPEEFSINENTHLLSPLSNRVVYLLNRPPDADQRNRILANRPGCRFLIVPFHFEEKDVQLDAEASFFLAPPRKHKEWLKATVGYFPTDDRVEPSPFELSDGDRVSDSDPLTIVIEDQGPGQALRGILTEKANVPKSEAWLLPYTAIQRMMKRIEKDRDVPLLIGGGETTNRQVDLLVVSQPYFRDLVDSGKLCRLGNGKYGYFLSINTGYLVYRRDFFYNREIRRLYYNDWQQGRSSKEKLRPPRNLHELLEKAAFFNYVDGRKEKPSACKELQYGLGLPHTLPTESKVEAISEENRIAFWSQWSMISRILIGKEITKANAELLDDVGSELFKKALWRFLVLYTYSSPHRLSLLSWDEVRRQLAEGKIAMAICWNDATYLFDEFVRRENERREKERREKIDVGYTLIGLDDNPARMPTSHIDGHIAILLTPEKKDAATQLFKWFEDEKIQDEFAHRGGSPISDEVVKKLEEQPDSFHEAYRMDLAAIRYGIPRADQPKIRVKALDQVRFIVNCLKKVARIPTHNNISEFQEAYKRFTETDLVKVEQILDLLQSIAVSPEDLQKDDLRAKKLKLEADLKKTVKELNFERFFT